MEEMAEEGDSNTTETTEVRYYLDFSVHDAVYCLGYVCDA
jgi:hypothetical protein